MKDLNIQKEIDQIKKVSLTSGEKSKMLHNISLYADFHMPVQNTYFLFSFWNHSLNKKLSYAIASLLIVMLSCGSAVYASEQSLPGDLLYPIKTQITEPIITAMAVTPEQKAIVETKFAERRLREAEKLDKIGRLTPKIKQEINDRLERNFSKYYEIKNTIEKEKNTRENDTVQKDFERKINVHAEILNTFNRDFRGLRKIEVKENTLKNKILMKRATTSENNLRKRFIENKRGE